MVERQTAIKVTVKLLLDGEHIQKDGWEPNFVRTGIGEVSRANVMGVITQETEPGAYILDDGSGSISLRTFEEKIAVSVGDPVLVIGRPRVYAGELFINYEILKKIDAKWLEYRKKELGDAPVKVIEKQELGEEVIVKSPGENLFSKIMDLIRELDATNNNQGAAIDDVIRKANSSESEHIVKSLLEEGEVFEIKPGMIKVLE
jgi:hypothetical protein